MRNVYLVASNVPPSDVSRTLGHEIIGHKGLRSVFGENFNTILDNVYNSHSEELIQYARTYNRDTETIENRRYLTEEFLSDCADANVKPSWWKEFIASLRQMLRRIFPKMRISDADINGWLSKAHRAVQQQSVQTATENGVRYAIIGEKGAAALDEYSYQNNLDNLQTAKQMLEAGKDAADIKLATGWEKGGDGKWRMEVPDLTVIIKRKLPDGNEYNIDNFAFQDDYLENIINAPELFSAYGQLRRIRVRSVDLDSLGSYSKQNNTIYLNYNDFINLPTSKQELLLRSVLIHEVQHAIQHIEGFASGGTLNTAVNENQDPVLQRHIAKANELMKERESLENKLSELEKSPEENEKQISSIKHRIERIETLLDTNRLNAEMATSPQTTYKRLAGEVEARNAERRQFFTGEEKRNSLLEASEDVAEESKIYLFDNAGESQMADGLFKYFSGSISDFLQKIKNTSNNQLIKKIIAPVSPKIAKYLYLKGIQIDLNYNHVIDNYSIIHVMNEHGKNSTEETRGQVPITEEDIKNIDNIINNYDGIVVDEKGGIVYSKRMQDGTVIYVEEVRRGRKELAFKTMRKMKGNIPNDLMEKMFSPENLNVLNESAILSFDDIILQKSEKSSGNSEKMRFSVAPQVDTPEFKNWFGDSKVVDENGNPLVVYHGSSKKAWNMNKSSIFPYFP